MLLPQSYIYDQYKQDDENYFYEPRSLNGDADSAEDMLREAEQEAMEEAKQLGLI